MLFSYSVVQLRKSDFLKTVAESTRKSLKYHTKGCDVNGIYVIPLFTDDFNSIKMQK